MKSTIFYSIFLSVALLCGNAQALDLPKADLSSPILKTIDARKSTRNFSSKPVSEQLLSNILWAAFGTNTHNTRTIPTAMNQQNLKVFVVYNNAVWQYDGKANTLNKIEALDVMPFIAKQDFVKDALLQLIYAGDKKFADAHSGSAYENVSLYIAEQGLASVVRGSIDREALHKALNLADDEIATFNQVIGYPAE